MVLVASSSLSFECRVSDSLGSTKRNTLLSPMRVYENLLKPIPESSAMLLDTADGDSEFLFTDEYSVAKGRQADIL